MKENKQMTKLKTPAEISTEIFNRVMKEFEKNWNSPAEVEERAEQHWIKTRAEQQTQLSVALSRVRFDLQKGTLIKIDLGPLGSKARARWASANPRPENLVEGDILMYAGWFQRSVTMCNLLSEALDDDDPEQNRKNSNFSQRDEADIKISYDNKATPEENEELSEAFSTQIQLFIKVGKEEVWTGLIPDFYYVILAEGTAGLCETPLFVQKHGLSINQKLIEKVVGATQKPKFPNGI